MTNNLTDKERETLVLTVLPHVKYWANHYGKKYITFTPAEIEAEIFYCITLCSHTYKPGLASFKTYCSNSLDHRIYDAIRIVKRTRLDTKYETQLLSIDNNFESYLNSEEEPFEVSFAKYLQVEKPSYENNIDNQKLINKIKDKAIKNIYVYAVYQSFVYNRTVRDLAAELRVSEASIHYYCKEGIKILRQVLGVSPEIPVTTLRTMKANA